MNKDALIAAKIDYENGKKRFAGNETLYHKYLLKFREDPHFQTAKEAYEAEDYETLIKEAHTLKGVAETLALADIYQTCVGMVTALREGRMEQITQLSRLLQHVYEKTINVLNS